jgi:hypothetical protein
LLGARPRRAPGPRPDLADQPDRHQTRNRSGNAGADRPARHAVLKRPRSTTRKVNRHRAASRHPEVQTEQARCPGMLLCCSQCASSDRCELDPRRSQRATMALPTVASWAGCITVGAGGQMNTMPRSMRLSISLSSWMVRRCSPAMTPQARSIRSCTRFRSDQWDLRPGRCLPTGRATSPCYLVCHRLPTRAGARLGRRLARGAVRDSGTCAT